jgi:very-short-patch-repair endonuclease
VFRTGVLEKQGWRLHRVWTPHFFRDPKGTMKAITPATAAGPADGHTRAASSRL